MREIEDNETQSFDAGLTETENIVTLAISYIVLRASKKAACTVGPVTSSDVTTLACQY